MSVKIISDSHTECPLIQEIGGYCFCRPNPTAEPKPQLKDKKFTGDSNKLIIDFAKYPNLKKLLHRNENADSTSSSVSQRHFIEVDVNFGVVPVETTVHREIVVIDSKSRLLKRIEIQERQSQPQDRGEASGQSTATKLGSVFRVVLPSSRFKPPDIFFPGPVNGAGDCAEDVVDPDPNVEQPTAASAQPNSIAACFQSAGEASVNKFRVVFRPDLPSMHYSEVYYVLVDHNAGIALKCRGVAEGPHICFSENVLNFGAQYYGDERRLKFAMHNHSKVEAYFQFDTDNGRSAFKICPIQGTIQPRTLQHVEVTFIAPKPQTYYKRVTCLIHHQQPQFVELVGLCIPRPFFVRSPIDFCLSTADTKFLPLPSDSNLEYFDGQHHWGIHISKDSIEFGYHDLRSQRGAEGGVAIQSQEEDQVTPVSVFEVSSILPYDVMLEWVQDPSGIFSITPHATILPARQSVFFEAHFNPKCSDAFYSGQLECYVFPTERIWPQAFGPPWTLYTKDQLAPFIDHLQLEAPPGEENEGKEKGEEEPEAVPVIPEETEMVRPSLRSNRKSILKKRKSMTATASEKDVNKRQSTKKGSGNGETNAHAPVPSTQVHAAAPEELTGTDSASKLSESFPVQSESVIFSGDDEMLGFPLTLTLRHSGSCRSQSAIDDDKTFVLQPHQLGSPDSVPSAPSVTDVGFRRKSFIYHHDFSLSLDESHSMPSSINQPEPDRERENSVKSTTATAGGSLSWAADQSPSHTSNQLGSAIVPAGLSENSGLVNEESKSEMPPELAIPLCVTVRVFGHTFEKHTPVPQFVAPKLVSMPPSWPLTRVGRTFMVKNSTDVPLHYDLQTSEEDNAYRIKPSKELIFGHCHQILLVSMAPRHLLDYTHNYNLIMNMKDENLLQLHGATQLPAIDVVIMYKTKLDEAEIVCPETMPGCATDTTMEFRNQSGFHYRFWFEPTSHKHMSVFSPLPPNGSIAPNEIVRIVWRFTPKAESAYYVRWAMAFNVFRSPNEYRLRSRTETIYTKELTLLGIGRNVKLECWPSLPEGKSQDFGMVQVFKRKEMEFMVKNPTNARARVALRLTPLETSVAEHGDIDREIQLEPTQFVLGEGGRRKLHLVVRPDRAGLHTYCLEYTPILTENAPDPEKEYQHEYKKICDVSFTGVHATLLVADAVLSTCDSRHVVWNAEQCWAVFSLSQLNAYLLNPSARDVKKISTVTFNFPPAPCNSEPVVLSLLLANDEAHEELKGHWEIQMAPPKSGRNTPGTPTSPTVSTPGSQGQADTDIQLLQQIWARKKTKLNLSQRTAGAFTPWTSILQNYKYFMVTPQKGCLGAGAVVSQSSGQKHSHSQPQSQSQVITFTYYYHSVGSHEIPVLLRVRPGVFIWIHLKGTTFAPSQPYANLMHASQMNLHPVCVSDLSPPIQSFWMFNAGNVDCPFEVDQTAFEETQEDERQVFECLTKSGLAPSRSWTPIKMRFWPSQQLQVQDYQITFQICSGLNQDTFGKATLRASGVDNPLTQLMPTNFGATSSSLKLPDTNSVIALSPQEIIFSQLILTGNKASSKLVLKNKSSTNKISFMWPPEASIDGGGSITFVPVHGMLKPGQEVEIGVTIVGRGVSSIVSETVRCWMIDETAKARYELMDQVWEVNKANLMSSGNMNETEAGEALRHKFGVKPPRPATFSRLVSIKAYIGTVFSMMGSPHESGPKLSPFFANLSGEIMSDMFWDMINSESLGSYMHKMAQGPPPYYTDYKATSFGEGITHPLAAQNENEQEAPSRRGSIGAEPFLQLPIQISEYILEDVIRNLISEYGPVGC